MKSKPLTKVYWGLQDLVLILPRSLLLQTHWAMTALCPLQHCICWPLVRGLPSSQPHTSPTPHSGSAQALPPFLLPVSKTPPNPFLFINLHDLISFVTITPWNYITFAYLLITCLFHSVLRETETCLLCLIHYKVFISKVFIIWAHSRYPISKYLWNEENKCTYISCIDTNIFDEIMT